jgi:hypothetical protein
VQRQKLPTQTYLYFRINFYTRILKITLCRYSVIDSVANSQLTPNFILRNVTALKNTHSEHLIFSLRSKQIPLNQIRVSKKILIEYRLRFNYRRQGKARRSRIDLQCRDWPLSPTKLFSSGERRYLQTRVAIYFWGYNIPNGKNIISDHRIPITNDDKIYQMVMKFTNIFHSKALQKLPILDFLVWNGIIPSGNPATYMIRRLLKHLPGQFHRHRH